MLSAVKSNCDVSFLKSQYISSKTHFFLYVKWKASHLEVVDLFIGALLLRCVFQGTPSHQRWGDLWTRGQQFNRFPQESSFAPQLDSQSQSQQLLSLPLLSFCLVGDQFRCYSSSVFFSLHGWLVGFPEIFQLLWRQVWSGDVIAVQETLPATAQCRGSSETPLPFDPGGGLTASAGLTLHLVWIQWQQRARQAGEPGLVVGGLRAGVCLRQWSSFTHPERERERENKVLNGQGPVCWEWGQPCCQDHFTQLNSSLKQDQ